MPNNPILREAASPEVRRDIGVRFTTMLLLSLVAVVGSIGWPYVLSPSNLTNAEGAAVEEAASLAMLLGSTVALILGVVAISRLVRGRWRRSWKSLVLTTVAAFTALPGLVLGSFLLFALVYSRLPLTASELHAVEAAERYVERNGYTTAGHPEDLPVLQNDIMDALAGSEANLKAMRKGTLQARAIGVSARSSVFFVYFESIPPGDQGAYRTVAVDDQGGASMMHQDMIPGFYKKAER